jgi:hypothetical protein
MPKILRYCQKKNKNTPCAYVNFTMSINVYISYTQLRKVQSELWLVVTMQHSTYL